MLAVSVADPKVSKAKAPLTTWQPFRLVFVMRDIEEMSTEETAANLHIRPEPVKTRLDRARRLLRKNLDEKLSTALRDTFPFRGARCARTTRSVLASLGIEGVTAADHPPTHDGAP